MHRFDNEVQITLSVLDRLLDFEPEKSSEPLSSRAKSLRHFKQAVRRDLEWLLNTRQIVHGVPVDMEEATRSLAAYGLPDFSGVSAASALDQATMRKTIERMVNIFEPRLRDVSVTIEVPKKGERNVHFRIDANLIIDPAPEPITFDTTLQLINGQYSVQES